jgi:hypothetical protein
MLRFFALDDAPEVAGAVGPVAERFLPGGAAAAQGDAAPAPQVNGSAFRVNQLEIPLHPEAAVIVHCDSTGHAQSYQVLTDEGKM